MEIRLSDIVERKATGLQIKLPVYPEECHSKDIISDNYYSQVLAEFGMHYIRGTAVAFHNRDERLIYSMEKKFRSFLNNNQKIKHAVEIGTWRGVSAGLIAHYADKVTTVDLAYYFEALPLWHYFGVKDKIKYTIVENNEAKKQLIDRLDFDFAFIDGMHKKEEVAYDFDLVKRCGRVLFHDYGVPNCKGVTEFINTLPQKDFIFDKPFAYWESNGHD